MANARARKTTKTIKLFVIIFSIFSFRGQGFTPKEAQSLDRMVKTHLESSQDKLIAISCKSEKDREEFKAKKFSELFSDLSGLWCVRKISNLWERPNDLHSFLNKHSTLREILNRAETFLEINRLKLSYLKNARALLCKSYFETRLLSDLAKLLKVDEKRLKAGISAFGFNRLFSPSNSLGATPSSDVDFKILVNTEKFAPGTISIIHNHLSRIKGEVFRPFFSLELEVEDFTVQDKDTFPSEEKEWRFLATARNRRHLCGDEAITTEYFENLSRFSDGELRALAFEQYLGRSDKGSISIIEAIEDYDLESSFRKNTFNGNYIGMREKKEKDFQRSWIFSIKYTLLRLYDFDSSLQETMNFNEIGLNLQDLVCALPRRERASLTQAFKSFDKIDSNEFIDLRYHFKNELQQVIEMACTEGMIKPKHCNLPSDWANDQWNEEAWKKFGRIFFSNLFTNAMAQRNLMLESRHL